MPLRLVPVLDLKRGIAVHAVAGDRAHYRPVASRLHPEPDPLGLARAFRERLGLPELYLADLDAIAGDPPALSLYRALADSGSILWVDAGLRDASGVEALLDAGVSTLVAGLETLRGPEALATLIRAAGRDRILFSLDLRDGRPVIAPGSDWGRAEAVAVVEVAFQAGARRILVLDLSRVGTGLGVGSVPLLRTIRVRRPDAEIVVGGGISGRSELGTLARAGASAALVGSALHDGRIDTQTCGIVE